MSKLLREAGWYGIASMCALSADAFILFALVQLTSMNYLVAAGISFTLGAAVAYVVSIRFAFHHHRLRDRRAEFASFVALGVPGLFVNVGVISILVRFFGLDIFTAKGVAALTTFSMNFLVRRQVLFVRK